MISVRDWGCQLTTQGKVTRIAAEAGLVVPDRSFVLGAHSRCLRRFKPLQKFSGQGILRARASSDIVLKNAQKVDSIIDP
jgi:hypothetical protein